MGGRVAMSYAAKYPKDVSDLVIEDMDMKRRSVSSNFIQNFNEEKAIKFERRHNTLDSIKKELESIGYPQDMYTKWINEGEFTKKKKMVQSIVMLIQHSEHYATELYLIRIMGKNLGMQLLIIYKIMEKKRRLTFISWLRV